MGSTSQRQSSGGSKGGGLFSGGGIFSGGLPRWQDALDPGGGFHNITPEAQNRVFSFSEPSGGVRNTVNVLQGREAFGSHANWFGPSNATLRQNEDVARKNKQSWEVYRAAMEERRRGRSKKRKRKSRTAPSPISGRTDSKLTTQQNPSTALTKSLLDEDTYGQRWK